MNAVIEARLASRRTLKSQLMPSIQARSYPVSAMVPSALPVQPAANTSKTATQKTDAVAPTGSGTTVSDRVSAFLASDTATEKTTNRPNRPPPPPPGGGKGPEGAGGSQASSETETALLLLETDETTDSTLTTALLSDATDASEATSESDTALLLLEADQADEDTEAQSAAILFDEAKTYYPTSIY